MLLHSLGQRLKKDTAGLGKGVAKEDGIGEGSCVTSSPTPFPPSRQLSPLPVFAMAVKVFSHYSTTSHALLWDPILDLGCRPLGLVLGGC